MINRILKLLVPIIPLTIITSLLLLLSSCGAGQMLMKADYDNGFYKDGNLKTDEVKVVKVNDNRFKIRAEKTIKTKPKKKNTERASA